LLFQVNFPCWNSSDLIIQYLEKNGMGRNEEGEIRDTKIFAQLEKKLLACSRKD
jgi:hypothetical protein